MWAVKKHYFCLLACVKKAIPSALEHLHRVILYNKAVQNLLKIDFRAANTNHPKFRKLVVTQEAMTNHLMLVSHMALGLWSSPINHVKHSSPTLSTAVLLFLDSKSINRRA